MRERVICSSSVPLRGGLKPEQSSSPGFDSSQAIKSDSKMETPHSKVGHTKRHGGTPLMIAIVIAVLGIFGMLIVDHGPWNKPKVHTAAVANYSTTGEAAREAGATVMPTEPKPRLEPDAPGPKPVHPANPAAPAPLP
jgi:hypothetical protein